MTIETLAKQGRDRIHTGLAGIDTQRLKAMRNASLRDCFKRLEETRYRMEFVARVRGREYINDAASRSINVSTAHGMPLKVHRVVLFGLRILLVNPLTIAVLFLPRFAR